MSTATTTTISRQRRCHQQRLAGTRERSGKKTRKDDERKLPLNISYSARFACLLARSLRALVLRDFPVSTISADRFFPVPSFTAVQRSTDGPAGPKFAFFKGTARLHRDVTRFVNPYGTRISQGSCTSHRYVKCLINIDIALNTVWRSDNWCQESTANLIYLSQLIVNNGLLISFVNKFLKNGNKEINSLVI